MSSIHRPRYALQSTSTMSWVILDLGRPPGDPRRTVARVYEVDPDEVEVEWLLDLPFPARYASATGVVRDLQRREERSRSERPVPIPHRRPPRPALSPRD